MNILDILIGIPLIWATYRGFAKGFIVGVTTLAALILGVYGALHFSDFTDAFIRDKFDYDSKYMEYISFIATFLIIVVVVNILGKAINSLVEAIALGIVNKLFGAIFGLMKGVLIIAIVVHLVDYIDKKTDFISEEKKSQSILYEPMTTVAETLFDVFDTGFGDAKEKFEEKVLEELPVDV